MAVFRVDDDEITPFEATTFKAQGWKERDDLQRLLKKHIEVISPGTLIVAEEFNDWENSNRRIDLLGINKDANLVVIELKRTEHGGHMELQAIRYAAMISTLTFDRLVTIYGKYLGKSGGETDARAGLLEHLECDNPGEHKLGRDVKIVLASADFSPELRTAVTWLNERALDIRCVRMRPYVNNEQVLLDVETIIPIPEVADDQVRVREKKRKQTRSSTRDDTKYDLWVGTEYYSKLGKNRLIFHIVKAVLENGASPNEVKAAIIPHRRFMVIDGRVGAEQLIAEHGLPPKRWFCKRDQIFYVEGQTCMLSTQWGRTTTIESAQKLTAIVPDLKCHWAPHGSGTLPSGAPAPAASRPPART